MTAEQRSWSRWTARRRFGLGGYEIVTEKSAQDDVQRHVGTASSIIDAATIVATHNALVEANR